MTYSSPLFKSTAAYVINMVLTIAVSVYFLANLLVSALAPVKSPFFNVAFVGLTGLILWSFVLLVYKVAKKGENPLLWMTVVHALFVIAGLGGFAANAFIR